MIPREHGAWAMLLVPFFVGTGVSNKIGLEAFLLLLTTLSLFLARQPVIEIVRSISRKRPETEDKSLNPLVPSFRSLVSCLLSLVVFGLPLLFIYNRWWLIPLGALGLLLLLFQIYLQTLHLERETWAEIAAIAGMSLTGPAAYYVSGNALDITAFSLWLLPSLYSGANVFYVKLRVRQRSLRELPNKAGQKFAIGGNAAISMVLVGATIGVLTFLKLIPPLTLLAFSPLLLKTLWAILASRAPSSIKRVGYFEIAHSLLFTFLLIMAYRLNYLAVSA